MPLQNNDLLEFKVPSERDKRIKARKYAWSPEQYLDFIETGMRMCPDLKKARALKMRHGPTVRFDLK